MDAYLQEEIYSRHYASTPFGSIISVDRLYNLPNNKYTIPGQPVMYFMRLTEYNKLSNKPKTSPQQATY